MPTLQRGYQFRLRPTPAQENTFRQWAGCRRLVWNYFLQRRQAHYRTTGNTLSFAAMGKELTLLKQQPDFAFLNDCDSQALQQALRDLCSAYKQQWQGRRLVVVNRWYPSSQECCVCHERTKHELSTRVWTCGCCGTLHDRDINAAKNILVEGLRIVARGNLETKNVCGATVSLPTREQVVPKQKPSDCEVRSPCLKA